MSCIQFKCTFIIRCLKFSEASCNPCRHARTLTDNCYEDQVESSAFSKMRNTLLCSSVLTAFVSLSHVLTPHSAFIAGENSGMRVYERTTRFWIFMTTNSMSFLLSIIADCALLAGQRSTHLRYRYFCLMSARGLIIGALMIITCMTILALNLDLASKSDNFWPISNLAVPIFSWIAVQNWRRKPPIPFFFLRRGSPPYLK